MVTTVTSIHRIFDYLLWVALFLSAVFFDPRSENPFELPKVEFVIRVVEIISLVALVKLTRDTEKLHLRKIVILPLLIMLLSVLSSVVNNNFAQSLIGNYYRRDGLFTLFHLVIVFILINSFWTNNWLPKLVYVISAAGATTALVLIFQFVNSYFQTLSFSLGFGGSFGQPVFATGYLLTSLPFSFYFAFNGKKKVLGVGMVVINLVGILITGSIFGFLGIVAVTALLYFLRTKKRRVTLGGLLIVGFVLVGVVGIRRFNSLSDLPGYFTQESREVIYYKGLVSIKEKPVLGWGWSNFNKAYKSVEWPKTDGELHVDKAHSSLLEMAVNTGLLGVMFYILLFLSPVIVLVKKLNSNPKLVYFLVSYLICFFHMQTNVVSVSQELLIWIYAGAALSYNFESGRPDLV